MRRLHPKAGVGRSDGAPLDPVLDFMRLLWNVEHGLQRTSKQMESTMGITGPQRLVLRIVSRWPGLSAGELARALHLHPSTITGILQRLIGKRLIARERDPRDRRRVLLHARGQARALGAPTTGTVEAAVTDVLARAPVYRVRQTRRLLSAIAEALDDGRRRAGNTGRRAGRPPTA